MSSIANATPESHALGNAVARTVDSATGSAHRVIDKASEAARPAVDQLVSGAHSTVDRLAGAANHAAESLDARGDQLKNAQVRLADTCRTQLREKPIATIGIAVAAGFLLSWLLRQR